MIRNFLNVSIFLFLLSGCTQSPAQIVMKGQQSYTRDIQSGYNKSVYNNSSYNQSEISNYDSGSSYNNTSVSQETEQNAAVDSIGITDLAPPTSSKEMQPVQLKSSPPSTSGSGYKRNETKTTINPWTNKPRSVNESKKVVKKLEAKLKSDKLQKTVIAKTSDLYDLKWPVAAKRIISSFGYKGAGKANDGINIAANDGDPVWAAADGEVVYVSNELKGYGNMILIKHSGRKTTSYAHLSRVIVDKYKQVKKGDVVGYVGSTGNVKTPQLFFSLHKGKDAIDPQKYIGSEIAKL